MKEEWKQRTGKRRAAASPAAQRGGVSAHFAAINDPRVDLRIRRAVEVAAEGRTGQVLRCARRMLVLPDAAPNDYETAPTGSLGRIEMPGTGKKHGEVVVFTPEQRRAVDDALGSYEAAWRAGQIDDYYLFPGPRCACSTRAGGAGHERFAGA